MTSPHPDSRPKQPNVVLIFSDQQHWEAMGCMDPFFETPALDAFAEKGILFERSFCTTPQCSPSRSTLLTGFYPSTTGVMGNVGNAGGAPLHLPTLGPELQAAGYHTGYFGKWHLGDDPTATAGWDECHFEVNDPVAEEHAVAFLENRQDKTEPFALFVSINNPHDIYGFRRHDTDRSLEETPLPVSWQNETFENKPAVQRQFMDEDQGKAIHDDRKEEWQQYHDCYREKTRLYDQQVGHVLDALDRSGRRGDTLVIITSDHGDMDTQHRLIFKGPFMYEHMVRVPLMIQVPEAFDPVTPRRVTEVDIVNTDLVPTLRDFCGLPQQESHGRSFAPLVTGKGSYEPRDIVVGQYYGKQDWVNPMRMIRTRTHKLIVHVQGDMELYDLVEDPHECGNRADDAASTEIISDLQAKLEQWMVDHQDPFHSQHVTDRQGNPLQKSP